MSDAEHLIENAVCALEEHVPYEAYDRFIHDRKNAEMAAKAGIPLDVVWEMAVYCDTTLRQDWKEKWKKEAERWIPVTERLPEDKEDVLVVMRYRNGTVGVNQGWYSILNEQWYVCMTSNPFPVTHWMPLPDAPEEENNG